MIWSGLILAGGSSRRMGADKALVEFDGATLLQRTVALVRHAGGEPFVIGAARPADQAAGAAQIDETRESGRPAAGPLLALRWGLARCGTRVAAAIACDLPLLGADLLRFLVEQAAHHDAVVPRSGGRLHVLAAAYTIDCLPAIDRRLAAGERAVHLVLDDLRVRIVDEAEIDRLGGTVQLTNLNTPGDLERLREANEGEGR